MDDDRDRYRLGFSFADGLTQSFLHRLALFFLLSTVFLSAILLILLHLLAECARSGDTAESIVVNCQYFQYFALVLFLLSIAGAYYQARGSVGKESMARWITMLSTAIEQGPAAVVITEPDGQIVYANPRFEKMSGYSCQEIRGKTPRILKSGNTEDAVYKKLWTEVLAGEVWEGEFENKRKDGEPYFVAAKISPTFSKTGQIDKLISIQEDITEKKRLLNDLEKLATIDDLTHCFNRSHTMKCLEIELHRARRFGHPFSVLSFDLDHFKEINDAHGHHGGDLLLKDFASLVMANLRNEDFFGRLGGEEFCAGLVESSAEDALLLAERLRKLVEQSVTWIENKPVTITVSIGLASLLPGDNGVGELLKRSDLALYRAKRDGRNRVAVNLV